MNSSANVSDENLKHYDNSYDIPYSKWLIRRTLETTSYQKNKFNRLILSKHNLLHQPISVFEIGFGFGNLLTSFGKKAMLNGSELSDGALTNLTKYLKYTRRKFDLFLNDPELFKKDLHKKFGLIVLSHVLEHLQDEREALVWCEKHLDANGFVLINIPVNENDGDDPKHFRTYKVDAFIDSLKSMQWNIEDYLGTDCLNSYFKKQHVQKKASPFQAVLSRIVWISPAKLQLLTEKKFFSKLNPTQLIVLISKKISNQ